MRKLLGAYYEELVTTLQLLWKVVIFIVMKNSVDVITYVIIGHLDKKYLAAAGLANVTANVVGNSILTGLVGALSTITAQAHGARNYHLLNVTLQRAVVILTAACIPLTAIWLSSQPLILMMGQSEDIAYLASKYLHYLIPGLFGSAYALCVQGWLSAQQVNEATAVVGVITTVLHPFWCYLFVYTLGLGYTGAAMALSLTRSLSGVLLTVYLIKYYDFKVPFVISVNDAFSDWTFFLRMGLGNVLMNSQWWAEEVIIFLSGTFSNPEKELAAMSVYQYMIGLCYIVPKSLGIVASSRVGHHLGNQDIASAKIACVVSPALSIIQSLIQSAALLIFRNQIGYIFTNDSGVANLFGNSLIFCLSVYVIGDSVQGVITGLLNGMGRQQIAGPVVFFCYYMIALPLAYFLASPSISYGPGLKVFGLTIGITVGTWIHAAVYTYLLVGKTDWQEEVDRSTSQILAAPTAVDATSNGSGASASGFTAAVFSSPSSASASSSTVQMVSKSVSSRKNVQYTPLKERPDDQECSPYDNDDDDDTNFDDFGDIELS